MFTGHSHELGSKSSPEDSVGAALQPINHPGCPRTSTRVTDQCRVCCFHSRAPKEGLTSDRSSPGLGPQLARRLVLPDSFYSPRVASQRGSIRCVHEVRRGEKRCLSSLRLLTWR